MFKVGDDRRSQTKRKGRKNNNKEKAWDDVWMNRKLLPERNAADSVPFPSTVLSTDSRKTHIKGGGR